MARIPSSLRDIFQQFGGGGMNPNATDMNIPDTGEEVHISSLALLKMLKHGRAGVPMEVMGLMLGEFVNNYAIKVIDVFSMPQSGNSVSVETVDPVYQTQMLEQLNRVGRPEMVVGWYHSHPGFGCWFSGTDVTTQQSFEQLATRAVGVVVDPIQSVKGKVIMDCFRLISPQYYLIGQESRQTTSNTGFLQQPSVTALVHGLNRNYYSIIINCRKSELENKMLLNLRKKKWNEPLKISSYSTIHKSNIDTVKAIMDLSEKFYICLKKDLNKTKSQIEVEKAGKVDVKKRLKATAESIFEFNIYEKIGSTLCIAAVS